jgi:plasmid stabilization system protein ParE
MVKVIWTDTAIEDLQSIGEFIAKDSVRYAEITVQELFTSVDILEDHPKAGSIVPELKTKASGNLLEVIIESYIPLLIILKSIF